ncbi:MAG: FAD-dependent oxidoreductase, partial [Bacillota bacterium]
MRETEIAVVGAGPAGLSAALAAASCGARVTLIDREDRLGGQLVKQTHKFFGSQKQSAGTRGIAIGVDLSEKAVSDPN